jgi:CDP-diacylglycerol---serine O-phosphatidyltransferase
MIKSLPIANAITMGNLACGLLSIPLAMSLETVHLAFYLMILAAILDFFDGFAARALNQEGPLGQQLDSLADLVSFGVVPGVIWYTLMQVKGYCPPSGFCINSYIWMLIPLAAAYRLGRFNVQKTNSVHFVGVPTPLTGLVLGSFAWIQHQLNVSGGFLGIEVLPFLSFPQNVFDSVYLWLYMPLLASFMMISEYFMFSLKFNKSDGLNGMRWLLVIGSVVFIPLLGAASLLGIYIFYLIVSFIAFRGKSFTAES